MKKIFKVSAGILFFICILLGLGYLGLAVYYENGFSFQTYINGIYCTGKSIEAVNTELNENYEYDGLEVVAKEGTFFIKAEDVSYAYDYRKPLNHYMAQQNPYLWIENLTEGQKEYTMLPEAIYSKEQTEALLKREFDKFDLDKNHQVIVRYGKDGFLLSDNKQDILDEKKAISAINNALLQGKKTIHLEDNGCYYDKPYTEGEKKLMTFFEKVDRFQNRKVQYLLGEDSETFSVKEMASILAFANEFKNGMTELPKEYESYCFDKDGKWILDEENAIRLMEKHLGPYNTYQDHTFTTHDGRTLHIKGGTYGNLISMKKEEKELLAFLYSDETDYKREPIYTKEVSIKGKNDIGDTYIEVDIGQQKMFYYRDGELYIETDVVTGKNNRTPEEVCFVYLKQKDRILRGPDYASPVKFWMPVSGGIGIHDASWRDEYGGDIYIRNGSHGCINTPYDVVEKMYEVVEVGTPCILYYGLDKENTKK